MKKKKKKKKKGSERERLAEADSNLIPFIYRPSALPPGQIGSHFTPLHFPPTLFGQKNETKQNWRAS